MNTKILLSVILILTLLLGVGFVSATDGDYNHDEKVDMTDTIDKVYDSVINAEDNNLDEKVDTTDTNQMTNTTDNKTNTETSDENHTNPSENLTPKNTNQAKEIKNKVSNDNSQTIYVEELKKNMTPEELINYCQNLRNKTKIDLLGIRLIDFRYDAIKLENKYLYNCSDNDTRQRLINRVQDVEYTKMFIEGLSLYMYPCEKGNDMLIDGILRLFGTSTDDLKGKLLDCMFSAKPKPTMQQTWNNKENFINTGITAAKHLWKSIFG